VVKIELEAVLQRGWPVATCGRPARSWGRTDLVASYSFLPPYGEIFPCGGLDPAGCKVGSPGQGVGWLVALLDPPGRGFSLRGPHGQRLTVVTLV
jgi:hypothetical protein